MPDGGQPRPGTGPDGDVRRVADPLLDQLLATGTARPGPLGLGLATDDGRLLADREDAEGLPVWTLGALRRGELWESTAIPEIRAQAAELAVRVMDRLVVRAATTDAAAAATAEPGTDPRPSFEDGLAVQRVLAAMEQSAAEDSRRVSVGSDDLAAPVPVTA